MKRNKKDPGYDKFIDFAIDICKRHNQVSPSLFQRTLKVDLKRAAKIFYQLKHLEIISKEKYIRVDFSRTAIHLGIVNKEKIRELSFN